LLHIACYFATNSSKIRAKHGLIRQKHASSS